MEIDTEHLDTIYQVGDIVLFILTVCHVIASPNGKQQHIHLSSIFNCRGDGNTTTFTSVVGSRSIHLLNGSCSGLVVGMLWIRQPCYCAMNHFNLELVGRLELGKLGFQMCRHTLFNVLWVLIGNQSKRELALDASWNDSLGTFATKGAFNSVKGQCRISPAMHKKVLLIVIQELITDAFNLVFFLVAFDIKFNTLVEGLFFWCQWLDGIHDSIHQNLSVSIDQSAHQTHQVCHCFVNSST
mmetsp:Transcript_12211/g.29098  ORF Transcript_12211/g.29098 Transcript_12211/m.29098 type:complete len:241 (-) Transcript_12211:773-1495(-)